MIDFFYYLSSSFSFSLSLYIFILFLSLLRSSTLSFLLFDLCYFMSASLLFLVSSLFLFFPFPSLSLFVSFSSLLLLRTSEKRTNGGFENVASLAYDRCNLASLWSLIFIFRQKIQICSSFVSDNLFRLNQVFSKKIRSKFSSD